MRWGMLGMLWVALILCPPGVSAQEKAAAATVEFEVRFNLIVIDVAVNDTPMKFVLDTGASATVLSDQTAKRLKLKKLHGAEAVGVSGGLDASCTRVKSLAVGGLACADHICGIMDLSDITTVLGNDIEGVLGYDFISQFKLTIDYRAKRATFEPYEAEGKADGDLFVHAGFKMQVRRPNDSWTFSPMPQQPQVAVLLKDPERNADVCISLQDARGATLDQLVPFVERSVGQQTPGFEKLSSARTQRGDKDCHELVFKGTNGFVTLQTVYIVFIVDGSMCSVQCSAKADEFAKLTDEFYKILDTIEFTK